MATHAASSALLASTSNAAGATTLSAVYDNTGSDGALIPVQITNGATAPTASCVATLTIASTSAGTYYATTETFYAGLVASATYTGILRVPPEAMFCKVSFSGNTGQAVTVLAAAAQALTGP